MEENMGLISMHIMLWVIVVQYDNHLFQHFYVESLYPLYRGVDESEVGKERLTGQGENRAKLTGKFFIKRHMCPNFF
jgi:hypothetical protein